MRLGWGLSKGCRCVDGGCCSAGLRVWSGRPQFEAVIHGGVSVQRCRCGQGATAGAWGVLHCRSEGIIEGVSVQGS